MRGEDEDDSGVDDPAWQSPGVARRIGASERLMLRTAFALLGRVLNSYIAAQNALDARFAAAPDQWQPSDRELYTRSSGAAMGWRPAFI